MLDDRERRALNEVERRLVADDPAFARSFTAYEQRLAAHGGRRRGGRIALTVAAVLCTVTLLAGSLLGAVAITATVWFVWTAWQWSERFDRRGP
ncbi:MAG TPA: DUF3040 domain-containing protein [Pseudonocardia sp.]|nr:DUF3040 domain-containing protein [Pseudonocardia sp.]